MKTMKASRNLLKDNKVSEMRVNYLLYKNTIVYNKNNMFYLTKREYKTLIRVLSVLNYYYKKNGKTCKKIYYGHAMKKSKLQQKTFQSMIRTLMPAFISVETKFLENVLTTFRFIKILPSLVEVFNRLEELDNEEKREQT